MVACGASYPWRVALAPNRLMHPSIRKSLAPFAATLCGGLLGACGTSTGGRIETEAFGSTTTHARSYAASPADTCEAARRALLSQGFVINAADAEHVKGRKNFQPDAQVHVEIELGVVCAPEGATGRKTIAFVNALQDRYALKKSNNSASVGVGAFGSLSLPFSSSDDSLVKVASETITAAPFYDRFFALLQRYMAAEPDRPGADRSSPAPQLPALAPQPQAAKPLGAPSAASAP